MSRLVILAAYIFFRCRADKQIDKRAVKTVYPPTTAVGVGNEATVRPGIDTLNGNVLVYGEMFGMMCRWRSLFV